MCPAMQSMTMTPTTVRVNLFLLISIGLLSMVQGVCLRPNFTDPYAVIINLDQDTYDRYWRIEFSCEDGHTSTGTKYSYCGQDIDGVWKPDPSGFTCLAQCDASGFESDIKVTNTSDGEHEQSTFDSGYNAYFSCRTLGLFTGSDSATCNNGTLIYDFSPSCLAYCPEPVVEDGVVSSTTQIPIYNDTTSLLYQDGTVFTFTCDDGYLDLNCTNPENCMTTCEDGIWDPADFPSCSDFDECSSNPCQFGGTCVDLFNSFNCTCVDGYDGSTCNHDTYECDSNPCKNGGSCVDLINSYNCTCEPGYSGANCETDIDECSSNPCQNDATCSDLVNSYACTCPDGYTGNNCENDIDECSTSPCQHGACFDMINSYNCTCEDGYEGTNCEIDIDECSSDPCQNGATCSDEVYFYNCTCLDGYGGTNCETEFTTALMTTVLTTDAVTAAPKVTTDTSVTTTAPITTTLSTTTQISTLAPSTMAPVASTLPETTSGRVTTQPVLTTESDSSTNALTSSSPEITTPRITTSSLFTVSIASEVATTSPSPSTTLITPEQMTTSPSLPTSSITSEQMTTSPSLPTASITSEQMTTSPSLPNTSITPEQMTTSPSLPTASITSEQMTTSPSLPTASITSEQMTTSPSLPTASITSENMTTSSILTDSASTMAPTTSKPVSTTQIITPKRTTPSKSEPPPITPVPCGGECEETTERCDTQTNGCVCRQGLYRDEGDNTCKEAQVVEVSMKITEKGGKEATFTEDLNNHTSEQFLELETEVCYPFDVLYYNNSDYQDCKVIQFSEGSIDVNYAITFGEDSKQNVSSITTTISEELQKPDGAFSEEYTFDNSSLNVEDLNECASDELNDCDIHAQCTDRGINGFTCECELGYEDELPELPGRVCTEQIEPTNKPAEPSKEPVEGLESWAIAVSVVVPIVGVLIIAILALFCWQYGYIKGKNSKADETGTHNVGDAPEVTVPMSEMTTGNNIGTVHDEVILPWHGQPSVGEYIFANDTTTQQPMSVPRVDYNHHDYESSSPFHDTFDMVTSMDNGTYQQANGSVEEKYF